MGWLTNGPSWWASATWLEIAWVLVWLFVTLLCARSARRRYFRLVEVVLGGERPSVRITAEDYLRRALLNGMLSAAFCASGVIATMTRPGQSAPTAVLLLIGGGVVFAANIIIDEPRALRLRRAAETEYAVLHRAPWDGTERRQSGAVYSEAETQGGNP